MDHLLAKLLIPFAIMLGTSALGIAVLAFGARRGTPTTAAQAAVPARGTGLPFNRSIVDEEEHDPHDTLVIDRRALRDSMVGLPQLRSRGAHDLRGPDAQLRGAPRDEEPPPPPRRETDARARGAREGGGFDSPRREGGASEERRSRDMFEASAPDRGPADRRSRDMFDRTAPERGDRGRRDTSEASGPERGAGRRDMFESTAPERGTGRRDGAAPPARGSGPRDMFESTAPERGRRDMFESTAPERGPERGRRDMFESTAPERGRRDMFESTAPERGASDKPGRDSGLFDTSIDRPAPRPRDAALDTTGRRRDEPPASPAERARPLDLTRQTSDRGTPPAGRSRGDGFDASRAPRRDDDEARDRGGLFDPPSRPVARPARPDAEDLRAAPPEKTMRAERDIFDTPNARPRRDALEMPRRREEPPPRRGEGDAPPPRETRMLREDDPRGGAAPPRETRTLGSPDPAGGRRIPLERPAGGGDRALQPVGVNIVLQQPLNPRAYVALPGKLEVIYGNFSPNDPREIPLYWPVGDRSVPRFVFSKSPGDSVAHIQLSHYTIIPTEQADLIYENGRHSLGNLVDGEEMDRYQIRVNGVAMGLGERLVLHSGDIISMGIYRLKLIV